MPLTIGTRLGPYEIHSALGAGGMGEVYRARDTRLGRDVAVKVSAEQFSDRFEREARAIATLNHVNICTLHDVGPNYLVMELVEGATLAERLKESPSGLPLDDVLAIARQIGDALEAAHEKGIVHRDLKPANIKITPDGVVKVLDFGLAKAIEVAPVSGMTSSTITSPAATQMGVIMGTAAYMAPEQARGRTVDKRADIWAFGVVLYEMLSGLRLFEGETVSDTIAQVLTKVPDVSRVPLRVQTLLRRCLERDPRKRLRDIGDAWMLLDAAPGGATPRGPRGLPWMIAAALGALAIALGAALVWVRPRPVDRPLMRLSVDLGPDAIGDVLTVAAISPDGSRLVFTVRGPDGKPQLATRLLDQAQTTLLPGTADAADPFFSPDGQWVGYVGDAKLKKVSVNGGAPVVLCNVFNLGRGGSWGQEGTIIAALNTTGGLSRVPEAGGAPVSVTSLKAGEATHRWPQILPGGKAVLFTAHTATGGFDDAIVDAISLATGARKTVVRGGYYGRYVPTGMKSGHLVYVHQGSLFAVAFDPERLETLGTPTPLLSDVAGEPGFAAGRFDFSTTGVFAYLSGRASAQAWPIVWLDSSGKTQPLLTTPGEYYVPSFSPDGTRLAVNINGAKGQDIHILDLQRDTLTRLTFAGQPNRNPVWTPDGTHIAISSAPAGAFAIVLQRADGAGEPQRLLATRNPLTWPESFSPDGKHLLYEEQTEETGQDLATLPLDLSDPSSPKPGRPVPFLKTPANERRGKFSPDGRWIAYQSDESGSYDVYVRPFPGPGGKWQISTGGGKYATWSHDGRQLFYETPDNRIMVVDYTAKGDSFVATRPRRWTDTRLREVSDWNLAIGPDGKRFAVFPLPGAPEANKGSVHVTFLLNFFDELRRRVPAAQ